MLKFLKRIILFIIATFVSINAAVFFILNSQTVQHAIVEYINVNYFNKQNLDLSLGSLSLSFLTGTLNLNEVYIKEKNGKAIKSDEYLLGMSQLSVTFNMTSSYVKRTLIVKKVLFRGVNLNLKYDETGSFILPDFLKYEKDDDPIDIPLLIKEIMPKVPFDFEAINIVFQFGSINQKNYQKISIAHAELNKIKDKKGSPAFQVKLLVNDSGFLFPWQRNMVSVSYLNTEIFLSQNGEFSINNLEIKSSLANLKTNIIGTIESHIEKSKYSAQIEYLDINGKDAFDLLEMGSSGRVILSGSVVSGKTLYNDPIFEGKARWSNLTLQGFDIYSGDAELTYKDRKIEYINANVRTQGKGLIQSKGEFQLYDHFYFENIVTVEKLSFAELLKGLRVSFTPVDFQLNSDGLKVSGYIMSPNKKKFFELFAKGTGKAQKMIVTTFPDQDGRSPIPDINFKLDLSASLLGLSLSKTEATIKSPKLLSTGTLVIDNGFIDFTPPKGVAVNVKMTGKNIDISAADYFLKFPTLGVGDMTGDLKVEAGSSDILFSSTSKIRSGEIFGLKFNEFNGKWGLNSKSAWAKNASILVGNPEQEKKSIIHLNNLSFSFGDMHSIIDANVSGELNNIVFAAQHWLPASTYDTEGTLHSLSVNQSGLFFHPSTWDLKLNSQIEKMKIIDADIKETNVDFLCKSGLCSNSSLSFIDIKNKDNSDGQESDTLAFALFELNNFSFEDSGIRAKINKLPLAIFSRLFGEKLNGYLNSNIQFKGKWNKIDGFANVSAYKVSHDEADLGDFSFQLIPIEKNNIKIDLHAFSNQISASYITQRDFEGDAFLDIKFLNFNAFSLVNNEIRSKNNLFSQINGSFKLSGISPLSQNKNHDWYRNWKGSGQFQSGQFQLGKSIFDLTSNNIIEFDGNDLKIEPFSLSSQIGKIQFGRSHLNFSNKTIGSTFLVDLNLGKMDQVTDIFGPSEGDLNGKFSINGSLSNPEIGGNLYIGAKTLFIKPLQPAFNNVNGNFSFKGKKLEIQNFYTDKGEGNITAAGSIDFSSVFSENPTFPDVSIKFTSRKADLRLQIPIFQIADINFDSDIIISGNDLPYQVSGDINLRRLRMFKDVNCEGIANQLFAQSNSQIISKSRSFINLNLNIQAASSITIQSQCIRGRFSTAPTIVVSGEADSPILTGTISTDNASLILLKSRFEVKRADFTFLELQKYDPSVDIQMESRISSYTIYASMNGRLSKSRLDLTISPTSLSNGDRITQGDIISMISTGQIPLQSSSANLLTASTSFFSFIGFGSLSENSFLNNTVSNVTGGIVDNVTLTPTSQNGQLSWRATASRSLSQRLNLGVSYEYGDIGTRSSAYATFIFNDTVSIFGSYDNTALVQQTPTAEFSSGLRFRFGSQ